MTIAEKDKDWSSREDTLNPSYNPKVQQLENVERQLKALTEKRLFLIEDIAREGRSHDRRSK